MRDRTGEHCTSGGSPPINLCKRGHDQTLPDARFPSGSCRTCRKIRNVRRAKRSLDGETCKQGHKLDEVGVNSNGWCKRCDKDIRDNRRDYHPEKQLLQYARTRAGKEGLPFNLVLADIAIPNRCPIFPHVILRANAGTRGDDSPTLDKIVPKLGYVKGNVQVISWRANRMKSDATLSELMQLGDWAFLKHKEANNGNERI